ncbi:hypothetical protein C8J56DRAFT_307617 [Mycena floridula]|nr:hypothetical protein C8J56DRAFT_307617 [Mycena floridula]
MFSESLNPPSPGSYLSSSILETRTSASIESLNMDDAQSMRSPMFDDIDIPLIPSPQSSEANQQSPVMLSSLPTPSFIAITPTSLHTSSFFYSSSPSVRDRSSLQPEHHIQFPSPSSLTSSAVVPSSDLQETSRRSQEPSAAADFAAAVLLSAWGTEEHALQPIAIPEVDHESIPPSPQTRRPGKALRKVQKFGSKLKRLFVRSNKPVGSGVKVDVKVDVRSAARIPDPPTQETDIDFGLTQATETASITNVCFSRLQKS